MAIYSISITEGTESFRATITKIPGMEQEDFHAGYSGEEDEFSDRDDALADLMNEIRGFIQTNP